MITFYKAVPVSSLRNGFIPGTVTASYNEAYMWWERYNSSKKNIKGAAKHINRQPSAIIKFSFDETALMTSEEFQRAGVDEHSRNNSWTSAGKQKAQINTVIDNFVVVLDEKGNEHGHR